MEHDRKAPERNRETPERIRKTPGEIRETPEHNRREGRATTAAAAISRQPDVLT
jgi:hypothetical protein